MLAAAGEGVEAATIMATFQPVHPTLRIQPLADLVFCPVNYTCHLRLSILRNAPSVALPDLRQLRDNRQQY